MRALHANRPIVRSREAGFTAIELSITSAILLSVLAVLFAMLGRLTAVDARAQLVANNQDDVRLAIEQVGRDVRAANPFQPPTSPAASATSFRLTLGDVGGTQSFVEWRYDPATLLLSRYTLPAANSATSAATATRVVLRNVTAPSGGAVFTFFCLSGTQLTATDAGFTSRLHVGFSGATSSGPAPFTVQDDIHLRNKTEEAC